MHASTEKVPPGGEASTTMRFSQHCGWMLTINLLYVCTFLAIYHQTKRGLPTWEGIHTDLLEGLLFCAPGFIASVIYTRSVKRGA